MRTVVHEPADISQEHLFRSPLDLILNDFLKYIVYILFLGK